MKPVKQLLRQPIRTIAALILLTASAAFLCLGWGVFRSARATQEAVEESFVTLARFGPQYSLGETRDIHFDEETGEYILDDPQEVIMEFAKSTAGIGVSYENTSTGILASDFWDALESGGFLRQMYQQQFLSARVPDLRTVTSATTGSKYSPHNDLPYNRAVLIFTLTDIDLEESEPFEGYIGDQYYTSSGFCTGFLRGEVTEYAALHPDYVPRAHVELSVSFSSRADLETVAGGLEIGKTYIVNMQSYEDQDLELRLHILGSMASRGYTVEDIDLGKIRCAVREEKQYGEYVYDDMAGLGVSLSLAAHEVKQADRCYSLIFQSRGLTLAPLTGSLEDFLANPDNVDWAELLDTVKSQYSTVPVIGTDLLKSLYLFHENIAYVAQGRSFESADYAQGRRVCLISETMAQANGLEVGDTISLGFYNGGLNLNTDFLTEAGGDEYNDEYNAQPLNARTEVQDAREYEIIGIYANTDQWSKHNYNLSPNTVLVPNVSLTGLEADTDGDFLKGIVVQNGSEEALAALFAEKGWPEDLLVFFDGGYAQISDTMAGFMDSPRQLLLVAAAAFIVILAAYIALFVSRQRRNAGLMRSLGAGRGRVGWFVFVTSAVPAALSCFAGAALGMLLLERVLDRVLGETLSGVAGYASMVKALPSSVVAVALAMLLADLLILGFVSAWTARRRPLRLLKK